jgi:pimeloyl-ACP methyl ester carboxylesterase
VKSGLRRMAGELILAVFGAVCGAAYAGDECAAGACRYQVGYRIVRAEDQGRAFNIAVWYPTDAVSAAIEYGTSHVAGQAAQDAPVKAGRWPLVVFAHGYSGSGIGSATIAEIVAGHGVVWAAPDLDDEVVEVRIAGKTTGNIRQALRKLDDKPPSLENYGYRIGQMRATLDKMLALREFDVDEGNVALAGHSLGGWTAMHLAFADQRPRALVLYSMGELNYLYKRQRFFAPQELSQLSIPAYFVYGSREREAVKRYGPTNSEFAYRNVHGPACLAEVRGGNHFVYVNREVARSGGDDDQLRRIADGTLSFLGRYLLGMPVRVAANECK